MSAFLKDVFPKLCYSAAIAGAVFLGVPAASAISIDGVLQVATSQNLPVTLLGTAFARLLLSSLRDELFTQPASKHRGDILEEAGSQLSQRPIVSNRSLIISSIFTALSIAIDPTLCLTVASATLGWELSGILYNIIGRVYSS